MKVVAQLVSQQILDHHASKGICTKFQTSALFGARITNAHSTIGGALIKYTITSFQYLEHARPAPTGLCDRPSKYQQCLQTRIQNFVPFKASKSPPLNRFSGLKKV